MKITNKYIFFWKENPFCNFTKCKIKYVFPDSLKGEEYYFTSSEQMFMWFKAVFFFDTDTAEKILEASTPEEARKLGREVKGYNDEEWNEVRCDFMMHAVCAKFYQNKELRDKLLDSKYDNKTFVEAAYYDRIWGIGFNENDAILHDESEWGRNELGKILNKVRNLCLENKEVLDKNIIE